MRIIDLSQEVYSGMPQCFAGPVPSIFDLRFRTSGNYEAVDDCCILQSHLGTHVDAPRHYDPRRGLAVHQLPLEKLVTQAIVLDLTHRVGLVEISAEDLENALAKTGETINHGDGALIYVGMGSKYRTWITESWLDSEYGKAPYLGEGAVKWLLGKRIGVLGIDALTPDGGQDHRPVHQILLRDNNIPIVENLCNLDKIAKPRVMFIALPPKIVGASGFLARAVAIEEWAQ